MTIEKGDKFGALGNDRHELDKKLSKQFEEAKKQEIESITDNRSKLEGDFKSMNDLQELISEAVRYKDEIEDMHVKLQVLSIEVKRMEE